MIIALFGWNYLFLEHICHLNDLRNDFSGRHLFGGSYFLQFMVG